MVVRHDGCVLGTASATFQLREREPRTHIGRSSMLRARMQSLVKPLTGLPRHVCMWAVWYAGMLPILIIVVKRVR